MSSPNNRNQKKYSNSSSKKILFFRNFFKKIRKILSQKITVMLIPHSENNSFNFRISFLTITIGLIMLTSIVLISIFSITENVETNYEIQRILKERAEMVSLISEFQNMVPSFKEVYFELTQSVNHLNEVSGETPNESLNYQNQMDSEYLIKKVLESDMSDFDEIKELVKLEYGLEKLIPEINSVATQLKNVKKIFEGIPSINPIVGKPYVTSDYGWRYHPVTKKREFHFGVDLRELISTPIRATASGKVTIAKYSKSAGNYVKIVHEYGFITRYMHLQKIIVNPGQYVKKGQIIGLLGNTGISTGPHLHYEVIINKQQVNPTPFLRLSLIME